MTDFASVEKDASQDLLKWKSLDLGGIQFALQPMQLRINEINLADFYARLILGADGKLNLQKLAAQKTAGRLRRKPRRRNQRTPVAPAPTSEKQISIGKINLQAAMFTSATFSSSPITRRTSPAYRGRFPSSNRKLPAILRSRRNSTMRPRSISRVRSTRSPKTFIWTLSPMPEKSSSTPCRLTR